MKEKTPSITKCKQRSSKIDLAWSRSPLAWLARNLRTASELPEAIPGPEDLRIHDVCAYLLSNTGDLVVVPFQDFTFENLLRDSRFTPAANARQRRGKRNCCHENCVLAWKSAPDKFQIQTGFGLNDDVWRRHTWLLDKKGQVVETTTPREAYFGKLLSPVEANWLAGLMQ